jgi:CBS domain-containing protein
MLEDFMREVVVARDDEDVGTIARRMRDRGVGCVVVTAARRPIGIVTDRDLALRVLAEGRDARTKVHEIMTEVPVTIPASSSLDAALATIRASGVRRLPLVDPGGEIVGIVTCDDLVVRLGRELAELGSGIEGNVDAPELR